MQGTFSTGFRSVHASLDRESRVAPHRVPGFFCSLDPIGYLVSPTNFPHTFYTVYSVSPLLSTRLDPIPSRTRHVRALNHIDLIHSDPISSIHYLYHSKILYSILYLYLLDPLPADPIPTVPLTTLDRHNSHHTHLQQPQEDTNNRSHRKQSRHSLEPCLSRSRQGASEWLRGTSSSLDKTTGASCLDRDSAASCMQGRV